MVSGKILGACFGLLALALPLFAQESGMEKRWKAQAMNQTNASDLDGKIFKGKESFADKSFAASQSGLQKTFSSKSFNTTPFAAQKDVKTAQRTFQTQPASSQETKFITQAANQQNKPFTTSDYTDQEKKPHSTDRRVESAQFTPKVKDPMYWESLREKLKKDLTMEEIRELLNKPPSN